MKYLTIFLDQGLLKLQSWDSTLYLFKHEFSTYMIPLPPSWIASLNVNIPQMPSVLAACLGTGLEVVVPLLLLLGIGGRIPAILFFILNYVSLVSYPFLWSTAGTAGYKDHIIWGLMGAIVIFFGHGKLSLDCLLNKKYPRFKY